MGERGFEFLASTIRFSGFSMATPPLYSRAIKTIEGATQPLYYNAIKTIEFIEKIML